MRHSLTLFCDFLRFLVFTAMLCAHTKRLQGYRYVVPTIILHQVE